MKKNNKKLIGVLAALLFFVAVALGKNTFAENGEEPIETVVPAGIPRAADTVSSGDEGEEIPPEDETRKNGDVFVDRVTLWDSDGNAVTGEVSFEKQYKLRYELISPLQIQLNPTDVMIPPYMEKWKDYLLPGISNDFIDFAGEIAVLANDSNGNIITVATVRIGADGVPIFTVDADLDKGSILNGYFEITVKLNREKIGNSEDYTFTFPKGESLTAEIVENRQLPPAVSKEAVDYDPDSHMITWRVTVQNPANPQRNLYPVELSDTIGEGQTYVEGSFRVTASDDSAAEGFVVSGDQLTWLCGDDSGNTRIQYEYQTEVDVLKLLGSDLTNADIRVSAENTLSATGADSSKLGDDIISSWPITGKTPISIVKSGGKIVNYDEEEDAAEIEWSITVENNGYEIKDLTVYDYFEAGTASVRLKEAPVCEPLPSINGRGYDPSGGINRGTRYRWSYHIGDVSGNAVYTITYTTVIENYSEYLKKNNGVKPGNRAWFDFFYPMGENGPSKEFRGPVISSEVEEIYADILEKTGVYDPATHRITWTIVVNPNRIELPDAVITDRIPDGQKYIQSVVSTADEVAVTTVENVEDNTVTFYFGEDGLSGRTATITLVTELVDSEAGKWANNWSGILENNVTLNADGLAEGGVPDTGIASARSMVIDKMLGNFDYTGHTIPVAITVNQNNMRLTGARVTDKLSDYGLVLVKEEGVQIDGISLKEGTEDDRPAYSYDGSTLVVYPEEVLTGMAKISFMVQVTDQYMSDRRTETVINFENIAALTSDQYGEEVRAKSIASMRNRPIVKSGTINRQTGVITYTVEFNRTLVDLPDGLILTDTLPDGLLLKLSTVKLWKADVNSSTGIMTKTDRLATGYMINVAVFGENTLMSVELPGGKQAYILEYDVQIVDKDKAPFVNRVDVFGYPGDSVGENSVSFSWTQVAGARLEDLIYIKVKKVDASGNPLAGAVFALKQGGELLLMGGTGEDGYVTFAGVEANTEYTVVELQAPEGYMHSLGEWTFITGAKGGEEYALEETFVNEKDIGTDEEDSEAGDEGDDEADNGDAGGGEDEGGENGDAGDGEDEGEDNGDAGDEEDEGGENGDAGGGEDEGGENGDAGDGEDEGEDNGDAGGEEDEGGDNGDTGDEEDEGGENGDDTDVGDEEDRRDNDMDVEDSEDGAGDDTDADPGDEEEDEEGSGAGTDGGDSGAGDEADSKNAENGNRSDADSDVEDDEYNGEEGDTDTDSGEEAGRDEEDGKDTETDGGNSEASGESDAGLIADDRGKTDDTSGQSRLPRTGGFWGSGIMYGIGVIMIGMGAVLSCTLKKRAGKCTSILLAAGVLLMASTFFLNMYAKWRNAGEVSSFEAELLLTEPSQQPDPAEKGSASLQEEGLPETAQEPPETAQDLQDKNGVLAVLSIPSISCKEAVKEGSSSDILAKALGHMEGTALPGQTGNCVIAGHRNYTFGLYFNRLNEVASGDEITVTTKEGVFTYIVTEIKVVEPEDLSVLDQTEDTRLTLITCTPIYIATHRLIVVAAMEKAEYHSCAPND